MPQVDYLKGKTVMIASTEKILARPLTEALEHLGATVVFSDRSPHHPSSIPVISEEVEKHEPKIDALIIHNSNIELPEAEATACELTKRLKAVCPVIVCDSCRYVVNIQRLRDAGAKYLNFMDLEPDQIAFGVAESVAVAQHGKPGRKK